MTGQAKILVVDDTPKNVKLLEEVLKAKGYAVITANSGPEALDKVAKEPVDLILLDVVMPEMSGYEVCLKIRGNPETTLMPIVMVTALDPNKERIKGIESGADDFITKPINMPELLARVQSLLRVQELHEKVKAQAIELAEVVGALGDIGHDIRNMLTPVVISARLLRSELDELFSSLPAQEASKTQASHELCDEVLTMLRMNVRRIQDRVKEIADCVKGLNAPPQFAPCNVAEVVDSVIQTLRVVAQEKTIVLHTEGLDDLPQITADESRLYNVFYNLINNAIPETPVAGSITVRGQWEPDQGAVVLSVTDTGRGMSPEVRDSLFTTQAISRKPGGTGLGTKIVMDVVKSHGGQVTVDSQLGMGTTFRVCLPLCPPSTVGTNP